MRIEIAVGPCATTSKWLASHFSWLHVDQQKHTRALGARGCIFKVPFLHWCPQLSKLMLGHFLSYA